MKINKTILAAALCLGVVGSSFASDVYISGSTACRGNAFLALTVAGPTNVFSTITNITTWGSGTPKKGNYMNIHGILNGNSGYTVVHCSWSGSEAGIANAADNFTTFPEAQFSTDADDGTTHSANPTTTAAHLTDVAFGDNAQSYSRSLTPVMQSTNVCVIAFKWLRNNGWWTGTNVTVSQLQAAFGGSCKTAVFSGNAADTNTYVYISGRDNGSGTRVNAFGTSGFGIFNVPAQIEMDTNGLMVQAGDGGYAEDWGYSSGGYLSGTLATVTTNKTDYVNYYDNLGTFIPNTAGYTTLGYLGYDDAQTGLTATTNAAVELSLNGIPFSASNIQEGLYTYWGNEYIFKTSNSGETDTDIPKVYNLLASTIPLTCYPHTFAGTAGTLNGIDKSFMHCTRSGPLSAPGHN